MIYDVKNYSDVKTEATTVENDMLLSSDSASIIFQMFSKNIYSNPIGSVVREITSNCFDSHVEAKVNAPVLIKKTVDENDIIYISFIDFGIGMSPERINKVYRTYFSSTKRTDNEQIGCFGLGSKSVLAYKRSTGFGNGEYDNTYFVITIFNGTKYYYQIYEGTNCPKISELYRESTTEHNGTEVRIPVLSSDVYKFKNEMLRQLYYFENIIFEGFDSDNTLNDYQIIKGKSFFYRGNDYSSTAHICLGKVSYPIDFGVLGLDSSDYRLPIAVRLEVGDINVTVSRESIDYSEGTIKLLKKKLNEAKEELIGLLSRQYGNIVTLEDYFNVNLDFGKLVFSGGKSIYMGDVIKKSAIDFSNFKYSFLKMPDEKQLFDLFFNTRILGKKLSERRRNRYYRNDEDTVAKYFEGGYKELKKKNDNLFYYDGEFNRKLIKQAYLKNKYCTYFIVSKNDLEFASRTNICDVFNVHIDNIKDDKGNINPFVMGLFELQEEYFKIVCKYSVDYNSIEVPEDFIMNRKSKSITKEISNSVISVKMFDENGHMCKHNIKLDSLFKMKEPIFYGTANDEQRLKQCARIFAVLFDEKYIIDNSSNNGFRHYNKEKILFIQLAQNNVKYVKFCKDAYHIDDIYNRLFYRKVDLVSNYFKTYYLKNDYDNISLLYKSNNFSKINILWHNKAIEVKKFLTTIQCDKNDKIGRIKRELSSFFDTDNISITAEQTKISKIVGEIKELEDNNKDILRYIDMNRGYGYDMNMDENLIEILKKVMIF